MFEKGFIVERNGGLYVPTEPIDLRKPFLEFVMSLPDREKCPVCERIFKEIGEHLAIVWMETEEILSPLTKERVLFGRLVKNSTCFKLMKKGAKKIAPDMILSVANEEMANTPLMKQLQGPSGVYGCTVCAGGGRDIFCEECKDLITLLNIFPSERVQGNW